MVLSVRGKTSHKMIVITVPFLNVKGMALFPFVLLRDKKGLQDPILINHERIHLQQQLELLIVPFYLVYLVNYLYQLISTFDHQAAYRNIIFEQEAYDHEKELNYLRKRKRFGFLDYL